MRDSITDSRTPALILPLLLPTLLLPALLLPALLLPALLLAAAAATVRAADLSPQSDGRGRNAEHVTLRNGFDLICDRREQNGDRVRLYTEPGSANFVEVAAADVVSVETVTLPAVQGAAVAASPINPYADLTPAELHELLSSAGATHNLDVNLLASVVRAESGGHTAAVSRKGAQGLMQLMPGTAAQLGVNDSLRPEQNVAGGAAYLDSLLTRYRDNLALALAAYNAGPAAVDRWHGVPPYRETRRYVARIIRDFNASVRNANRISVAVSPKDVAESAPVALAGAIAP